MSDEETQNDRIGAESVVRGFEVKAFESWESWSRLKRLLASGHGAYGLAGPRGAGKTWLMQRAGEYAKEKDGLGLWFPSPSEYDSAAFLAALTQRLAEAVEEGRQERVPVFGFATLGPGISTGIFVLYGLLGALYGSYFYPAPTGLLAGALSGLTLALVNLVALRLVRAVTAHGRALLYARDVKERLRFALTRREGIDFGASAAGGLAAKLGVSRQVELAERPVTLSSLIHDFRRLATLAARASNGPVVIGIDELDKIDDEKEVRRLLRDVKGVFGVPGVHFLVSVSHEAARALNLNGIVERNEFNSSFDVVLELDRVRVEELSSLLQNRGWLPDFEPAARAIAVLSGGLPREAVRLAESAMSSLESRSNGSRLDNSEFIAAAIRPEALELRRAVVASTLDEQGEQVRQTTRVEAFQALSEELLSVDALPRRGKELALQKWASGWSSDSAWTRRFEEEWRRLMVRIYVAALLVEESTRADHDDLQRVVSISTQSATVAMLTLLDILGLEGQLGMPYIKAANPDRQA